MSPHVESNTNTSQQGKPERETLRDQCAAKNGGCWGLYLATEGFVVAASFVLPVLSIIMEVMEKAFYLQSQWPWLFGCMENNSVVYRSLLWYHLSLYAECMSNNRRG